MRKNQRTIKNQFAVKGSGIHTGNPVEMIVKPAPENSGVVFKRVDLPGAPMVAAVIGNVDNKPRRTGLSGDAPVETVEHFLAALFVLGIDNLLVEINSTELPSLDGSAQEFYTLLKNSGIAQQSAPAKNFSLKEKFSVSDKSGAVTASPGDSLKVSYELAYPAPTSLTEKLSLEITEEVFAREIAPARTFCTEAEAKALLAAGFGKGATLENTVVIKDGGKFSTEPRFPDECVRHKILDVLGDLFFLGGTLAAKIECSRSGHALNKSLVQKILSVNKK